jgi:hypothetical protein
MSSGRSSLYSISSWTPLCTDLAHLRIYTVSVLDYSQTILILSFRQVTILNGSSLIGRILAGLPGLLRTNPPDGPRAKYPLFQLDVPSMVVLSGAGCTLFVFVMIGVKNVAGFIALAVFFGGFNGACTRSRRPRLRCD